jgi:indole-3-pyruvate monooxygenase
MKLVVTGDSSSTTARDAVLYSDRSSTTPPSNALPIEQLARAHSIVSAAPNRLPAPAAGMQEEVVAVIVGAGPAGLAAAACLGRRSVPYLVVEREGCSASLWRRRAYDRLKLHLAKEFCALPHAPFPDGTPTYVPKREFVAYLDAYAERFGVEPRYCTSVESAACDEGAGRWVIAARDTAAGTEIRYKARFLVVATGENGVGSVPEIPGMESFPGEAIHSSTYRSGGRYAGQRVLVVGSGNSGMEIAYDLANHGADTSIVVRSPVCIF